MCYSKSVSSLHSWGIPDITRGLRRRRLTIHKIDSVFTPDSRDCVEISPYWTETDRYTGETRKTGEIKVYLRKDSSGLYLDLQYTLSFADGKKNPVSLRYDLVRRESNLKPGTYRYYIKDPYSQDGEGICTRLYFIPELGEFVPRSILTSWRVRYSQQRKGRKDRYFYPSIKTPDPKYRKTHYRGQETPFGRRSRELREEREYREILSFVGMGWTAGLIPREDEWKLLEEYCRVTGRKTLPSSPLSPRSRRLYLRTP